MKKNEAHMELVCEEPFVSVSQVLPKPTWPNAKLASQPNKQSYRFLKI